MSEMPGWLPPALAVALGLCVGSFLNVVIHRLPRGESVVSPPSRCPRCGRGLRWFDNIPVVSWLLLGGRCRGCAAPISAQYPIVEAVTAALALLVVVMTPADIAWPWLLISRLLFTGILVALFAIDLEHQILPNVLTLPGIVIGFVLSFLTPVGPIDSLLGILLGAGVLYAIAAGYYLLRKEEGMGMGDVKMLAMIGAFLGWKAVLLTLVMASFAGSVVGVGLMALHRGSMKYALPFGTFLAIGALLAMLVGEALLAWYLGFF